MAGRIIAVCTSERKQTKKLMLEMHALKRTMALLVMHTAAQILTGRSAYLQLKVSIK